jgi:plastocyanin
MPVPMSKLRRWGALTTALLLVSGALAACGGDSDDDASTSGGATAAQTTESAGGSSGSGAGATLVETADESGGLSFSRGELTASAGSVTVTLDNPSGNELPHAIEIEGNGVEEETETIEPGARASVTVDLRPGRYTFYCPVGDHRAAGMEGTLTVS